MADQAINALSTKTAPETSDQLLLVGTGEPQLIDYDKLADAILNKITSKNYALDAGQMTLLAALNKLNSEIRIYPQIFQLEELGSLDEFVVHLLIMVILLVTDMLALLFLKTFVQQSTQTLWIHILK